MSELCGCGRRSCSSRWCHPLRPGRLDADDRGGHLQPHVRPAATPGLEGTISADGITGVITLPGQSARRYFAGPAGEGAGIYDVIVQQDRGHAGTSEEGGKLELIYKDGMVNGKVTAPDGRSVDLLGADLTHAYRIGVEGSLPGTYVAFAAPAAGSSSAAAVTSEPEARERTSSASTRSAESQHTPAPGNS